MVLEEDRWPGVCGPFMVHKDGRPFSHTLVRQDDPDLAVVNRCIHAVGAVDDARQGLESVRRSFALVNDADQVDVATVQAMRHLLNGADRLRYALIAEKDALKDWAVVLDRIGFYDAFGEKHPLPDDLAALLPTGQEE